MTVVFSFLTSNYVTAEWVCLMHRQNRKSKEHLAQSRIY